jgi:hypothetical protein
LASSGVAPASVNTLRDVLEVLGARLDEALLGLEVVVAIRQAQAAGVDVRRPASVVQVLRRIHQKGHRDADVVQVAMVRCTAARLDRADFVEPRLDRRETALVDARFVHAGGVVSRPTSCSALPWGQSCFADTSVRMSRTCSLLTSPDCQRRLQRSM